MKRIVINGCAGIVLAIVCSLLTNSTGAQSTGQGLLTQAGRGDASQGRGPGGRGGRGGRGGPRLRKAVLAWADTRNGLAQHDSVSHALAVIERLGYESGAYDTYIRTDSNIIAKSPLMTTGQPASGGP